MKNILKLSGIIVLVAVIGFSFAACSNGSTDDPATGLTGAFVRTVEADNNTVAVYELTVTGTAAKDCVCSVTFNETTETGDVSAGTTAQDVVDNIEYIFQANTDVTDNFTVTSSGTTITLTGKYKNNAFNVPSSIPFK